MATSTRVESCSNPGAPQLSLDMSHLGVEVSEPVVAAATPTFHSSAHAGFPERSA